MASEILLTTSAILLFAVGLMFLVNHYFRIPRWMYIPLFLTLLLLAYMLLTVGSCGLTLNGKGFCGIFGLFFALPILLITGAPDIFDFTPFLIAVTVVFWFLIMWFIGAAIHVLHNPNAGSSSNSSPPKK